LEKNREKYSVAAFSGPQKFDENHVSAAKINISQGFLLNEILN